MPAHEIHPSARDEFIYVQGVIDCLFSEGDALILVDYKADSVTEDSVSAVAERYRAQIDLYTRATGALFRRTVAQRYIYFFALGRALVI
ncbi:MAG: ATP-dependent helicase/nuclease subunit A [Firmicutes bacterium]|nr:ATP-dependent helicase/nuclease subunit A [candidate division NPL-UPA2 bacterium]